MDRHVFDWPAIAYGHHLATWLQQQRIANQKRWADLRRFKGGVRLRWGKALQKMVASGP